MKIAHSLFSSVTHAFKSGIAKGVKSTFNRFFAQVDHIKNNDEKLKCPSYKFLKSFSANYNTKIERVVQTGFISHFGRYQEPAIFIHGSGTHYQDGKGIYYFKGMSIDNKNINGEEIVNPFLSVKEFVAAVKKDFNLDLHRTGNTGTSPLHLVCCYSGGVSPDSIAGQLSRELERSVVSYGENSSVGFIGCLADKMDEHARIYSKDERYPNGIFRPLQPIIHFPDNKPGQIRT